MQKVREQEIKNYKVLNKLAEQNGIVIFGGKEDISIPLCELRQAFGIKENCYNRSFENLTISEAFDIYADCVADLSPETILLHIEDVECFKFSADKFTDDYRKLISQIKKHNKKCRIGIVSAKNYDNNNDITELNKQLKYIADSEKCEFCDISEKRVWNPQQTKEVVSFVYNIGFMHPLKTKRPLNDLVRSLFCVNDYSYTR